MNLQARSEPFAHSIRHHILDKHFFALKIIQEPLQLGAVFKLARDVVMASIYHSLVFIIPSDRIQRFKRFSHHQKTIELAKP